jgi:hypothetical protein
MEQDKLNLEVEFHAQLHYVEQVQGVEKIVCRMVRNIASLTCQMFYVFDVNGDQ